MRWPTCRPGVGHLVNQVGLIYASGLLLVVPVVAASDANGQRRERMRLSPAELAEMRREANKPENRRRLCEANKERLGLYLRILDASADAERSRFATPLCGPTSAFDCRVERKAVEARVRFYRNVPKETWHCADFDLITRGERRRIQAWFKAIDAR